jgi:hypothetical protein
MHMERFLHLWDELDDLAHACRHVAGAAASEVAAMSRPLVSAAATACAWLLSVASLKGS